MKRKRCKDDVKRRQELYGCDGNCYGYPDNNRMCPLVETCPETRTKEFLATLFVIATAIICVLAVAALIIFSVKTIFVNLLVILLELLKGAA